MMKQTFLKHWFPFVLGGTALLLGIFYGLSTVTYSMPAIWGVLISLCILALYGTMLFQCWLWSGIWEFWAEMSRSSRLLLLLPFLAAAVLAVLFLSQEQFIYYWDYGGYWSRAIQYRQLILDAPEEAIPFLYQGINSMEYNYLVPAVIALPMILIGTSFTGYAMVILVLLAFPMLLTGILVLRRLVQKARWNALPPWAYGCLLGLSPVLFRPILSGYCDAACLLTAMAAVLLVFSWDWRKFAFSRCTVLGSLLLLTMLQRRYFAYLVVGFAAAFLLMYLIRWIQSPQDRRAIGWCFLESFGYIGGFCGLVLIGFFRGFLLQSISGDFAVAYSAYSFGSLWTKFQSAFGSFGILILLLAVAGIFLGLWNRALRVETVFLLALMLIPALLFFRVQSMGEQHRYLLWIPVQLFVVMGVGGLANLPLKQAAWASVGGSALLCGLELLLCLSFLPMPGWLEPLYSGRSFAPKIRHDIPQVQQLAEDLNALAIQYDSNVYVLASSSVLNDDILRKSHFPDLDFEISGMFVSSHVDLRDGFPLGFFVSNLVVVGDPVQYHLSPQDQQTIGILADLVLDPESQVGRHYRLLGEYTLDKNVTAKVFYRETLADLEEIRFVEALFDKAYPESPLFIGRIEAALTP